MNIFFSIFFFLIFIFEGLGISIGRIISYYLILALAVLLIGLSFYQKRKLKIPKKTTLIYASFLFFLLPSVAMSTNILVSVFWLLFYVAIFLVYLITLNNQQFFEKVVFRNILIVASGLLVYSTVLPFLSGIWIDVIPKNGYQYVYSTFGSHLHIGDLLIVPLIFLLYQLLSTRKLKYLFFLLSGFLFLILSFSRSAYLAFFITAILLLVFFWRSLVQSKAWITLGVIFITLFFNFAFLFIIVNEAKDSPLSKEPLEFLRQNTGLKNKSFEAKRLSYFNQAILSIQDKPVLGVGPGNFWVASYKFTTVRNWTQSSHNILLDHLSEDGIIAGFFFLGFIVFNIFTSIKRFKKLSDYQKIACFCVIGLLINFQFDYTFKIYSFLLLFFILLGLINTEKE